MRPHLLAVAAGLLALAVARPADAKCARAGLAPEVLTPEVSASAGGGGIVVGTKIVSWDQKDEGQAPAKGWGFLTGRDLAVPVITTLAPGLVVYAPPPGTRTTGELTTGSKVVAKLTTSKATPKQLAAPTIRSISHERYDRGRGRSSTTTVTLAGDVPAGAVALVLVDARTKKAQTWGTVQPGERDVVVYAQRRCTSLPDGTIEPAPGQKVILRWVDRYGRVSADSAPVAVATRKADDP